MTIKSNKFIRYVSQISGERLQDHWSSGLRTKWFCGLSKKYIKQTNKAHTLYNQLESCTNFETSKHRQVT